MSLFADNQECFSRSWSYIKKIINNAKVCGIAKSEGDLIKAGKGVAPVTIRDYRVFFFVKKMAFGMPFAFEQAVTPYVA